MSQNQGFDTCFSFLCKLALSCWHGFISSFFNLKSNCFLLVQVAFAWRYCQDYSYHPLEIISASEYPSFERLLRKHSTCTLTAGSLSSDQNPCLRNTGMEIQKIHSFIKIYAISSHIIFLKVHLVQLPKPP